MDHKEPSPARGVSGESQPQSTDIKPIPASAEPPWEALIATACGQKANPIEAFDFVNCPFNSRSKPAVFKDEGGEQWVVKSNKALPLRWAVNDCIAATLGLAIGAPVFEPKIIQVDDSFNTASELSHFRFGFCYATQRRTDVGDRLTFDFAQQAYNRIRFVLLALLYGWYNVCQDHQVVYRTTDPHEVFSIDHEHSIVNSGEWLETDFPGLPAAEPYDWIVNGAVLTQVELNGSKATLEQLTPKSIATAVAAPHDSWGITDDERVALAELLWKRKQDLVACLI